MPIGSPSTSLALLLASCGVLVALHLWRIGGSIKLKPVLIAGALSLIVVFFSASRCWSTISTYPKAENHRLATKAALRLEAEIGASDSLVVLDGSSVFAHGLPEDYLQTELQKLGHHSCVISTAIPGADHFERECTGEDLWAQLSDGARARLRTVPILWVKELHWNYEAWPARFLARDSESSRMMAQCDLTRSWRIGSAIVSNWKDFRKNEGISKREAFKVFPWDRLGATVRLGAFNLFCCGQLQRLLDLPVDPQFSPLREQDLQPVTPDIVAKFWNERLLPDDQPQPNRQTKPRQWFDQFIKNQPSGWPADLDMHLVLYQPPSYGRTERRYTAHWKEHGPLLNKPVLLANTDVALLKSLDNPTLWRDAFHMERAGAAVLAPWVAQQLHPKLPTPKP